MQQETPANHAVKWGIIIGLVYCVLLWLRYSMGSENLIMLGVWSFVGFVIVIILLVISGIQLRKKQGGFIEFKDIFKYLFITVLIYEAFYAIFNFIYIKYVDPEFFTKLKVSMEELLTKTNQPQDEIDKQIEKMDKDAAAATTIGGLIKSYLISIAISGTCALIIAAILKKKKDPFLVEQESNLQA
jgi:hypothetical protein